MDRLVVVGASLAGLRAAQAARAAGFTGALTLVGEETHRPYNRPPLSKELLWEKQTPEQLAFPCDSLEVDWRLGTKATGLDRTAKQIVLADGDTLSYDRLIIATGTRARRWNGPGGELDNVYVLRDLDDALALQGAVKATAPRPRVAILGAGFIGCEVAASLRGQGLAVTLIDIAPLPMTPLGPELGGWCAELHAEHGVELALGVGVHALHGDAAGRVNGVELADGRLIETDLVVVGLGALPNTEWLIDSGLDVANGVAADPTLTTTQDPDVLAAGDIVAWPHPLAGVPIRIEHWGVAAEQGQLAGRNALLEPAERTPHTAPPYFWSDQYDVKIQAVGLPGHAARLERLEASPDGRRVVYAGERDGRLVGVIALNAAKRLAVYRRQLADPPVFSDLKAAVAADPGALEHTPAAAPTAPAGAAA